MYTDGASKGNPGPAGVGVVILSPEGDEEYLKAYLGHATNNQAEYEALILGLDRLLDKGVKRVIIKSDSELLVRQLKGKYKVRNPGLKSRFDKVRELLNQLEEYDIFHIRREENSRADKLANEAIKEAYDQSRSDDRPLS